MPQGRRRARPLPWELTFTLTVTLIWVVTVAYYAFSALLGGEVNVFLLACFTLALVPAWWLAASVFAERLSARKTLRALQALEPEAFEAWVAARFR